MSELIVEIDTLPEEVREKLAELDLELSEGKRIPPITAAVPRRRVEAAAELEQKQKPSGCELSAPAIDFFPSLGRRTSV